MKVDRIEKNPKKRGVKLFVGNKHVKTIAKKFECVAYEDFIESMKTKRITPNEKLKLNTLLFKAKLNKYEKELVENVDIDFVRPVINFYQDTWFEAVFKNKVRVKCDASFFKLFPNKKELVHLN